jgi:polygalacturonase
MGGIRHVYFSDNILRKGISAIRFKANLDRGGTVEHIRVRNIAIKQADKTFVLENIEGLKLENAPISTQIINGTLNWNQPAR